MYAVVLFLQHYFSDFYSAARLGLERSTWGFSSERASCTWCRKALNIDVRAGRPGRAWASHPSGMLRDLVPTCHVSRKSTMCISGGES